MTAKQEINRNDIKAYYQEYPCYKDQECSHIEYSVRFFKIDNNNLEKQGRVYVGLPTEISTGGYLHINIPGLKLNETRTSLSDEFKDINEQRLKGIFGDAKSDYAFSKIYNEFIESDSNLWGKADCYIPIELYEKYGNNNGDFQNIRFICIETSLGKKQICSINEIRERKLCLWTLSDDLKNKINTKSEYFNKFFYENANCILENSNSCKLVYLDYIKDHVNSSLETISDLIEVIIDLYKENDKKYYYLDSSRDDSSEDEEYYEAQGYVNLNELIDSVFKDLFIKENCNEDDETAIAKAIVENVSPEDETGIDRDKAETLYYVHSDNKKKTKYRLLKGFSQEDINAFMSIFGEANVKKGYKPELEDCEDGGDILEFFGTYNELIFFEKDEEKYYKYIDFVYEKDFFNEKDYTILSSLEWICNEDLVIKIENNRNKYWSVFQFQKNQYKELLENFKYSDTNANYKFDFDNLCSHLSDSDVVKMAKKLKLKSDEKSGVTETATSTENSDLLIKRNAIIEELKNKLYIIPYSKQKDLGVGSFMQRKFLSIKTRTGQNEYEIAFLLFETSKGDIDDALKLLMQKAFNIYYGNSYTPLDEFDNIYPDMGDLELGTQEEYEDVQCEIAEKSDLTDDEAIKQLLLYQYVLPSGKMIRGYGKECPILKMPSYIEAGNEYTSALNMSNALCVFCYPLFGVNQKSIPLWGSKLAEQLLIDYAHDTNIYLISENEEYLVDTYSDSVIENIKERINDVGYNIRIEIVMRQQFETWSKTGRMKKNQLDYKSKKVVFDLELTAAHRAIIMNCLSD